ncbi:uncharacterized protein LOC125758861 [Rhipicephalus sanguineus]|uniref:uncharacterized protein LOC125758861 n=1 Tax=Rhipicephalus sanguineus TaxID=34632 RepID=UPI0020C5777C|nr:uncharacterized protein LOC125758861 [Rhipicephalus sanguineus]
MSTTSSCVQRLCCVSWCVLLLHNFAIALPETIYIGALLEDDREDREQELALRYAIDRINNNNAILPASRLRLLTQRLPPGHSFHAFKTVHHNVPHSFVGTITNTTHHTPVLTVNSPLAFQCAQCPSMRLEE